MNAILESVMYVENEYVKITEKLPLVDDWWYCSYLDYMLIFTLVYVGREWIVCIILLYSWFSDWCMLSAGDRLRGNLLITC